MRLLALTLLFLGLSSAALATGTEPAADTAARSADAVSPPEPDGFWNGPTNDPVPSTIKGGKVIHAQALAALLKRKNHKVVVVDVSNGPRRPDELPMTTTWLPVPHQAIPGALWIPGAGLGEPPSEVDKYFRERLAAATDNDPGRLLVFYCHEKCWLSWNGAKRAILYGYRNVYWFPDGIEGWRKARLPTVVVQPEPVP